LIWGFQKGKGKEEKRERETVTNDYRQRRKLPYIADSVLYNNINVFH
jgi:hypothetical protein